MWFDFEELIWLFLGFSPPSPVGQRPMHLSILVASPPQVRWVSPPGPVGRCPLPLRLQPSREVLVQAYVRLCIGILTGGIYPPPVRWLRAINGMGPYIEI